MAKKFGKLLVFSAVIGSAIGAVCYFARKKNAEADIAEEDYDDFSEDEETKSDDSRSYVPLTPDAQPETAREEAPAGEAASEESPGKEAAAAEESGFTPLSEQVAETAQKAEETVEEFFDEEDSSDEEPPISDN
ncbi:MAG: hypothetical protein HFH95_09955 [Lachnospiraceae bacterium]|nr:hypothetical protein [uncultured Acetatifactor sp.]MCI8543623.1 hypothetical protein [Lachnospiraceae bacterium]